MLKKEKKMFINGLDFLSFFNLMGLTEIISLHLFALMITVPFDVLSLVRKV